MRLVAKARFEGGALEADRPDITVGKALDPGILFAKADTAGEQHQRRIELHATEIDGQHGLVSLVHSFTQRCETDATDFT